MEILRTLVPSNVDDAVIANIYSKHKGNLPLAANELVDSALSKDGPSLPLPSSSTLKHNIVRSLFDQLIGPNARVPLFTSDMIEGQQLSTPTKLTRCHIGLSNGDCVFYTLFKILQLVTGSKLASRKRPANDMRIFIGEYIDAGWYTVCRVNDMLWSDIVRFAHNSAVTAEERDMFGDWGNDERTQLQAYRKERECLFGGEPEIIALVDAFYSHHVPLVVRVWRKNQGHLLCSSHYPSIERLKEKNSRFIVADLLHTGAMDTCGAHMQLLRSGSFEGYIDSSVGQSSSLKRDRLANGDEDF